MLLSARAGATRPTRGWAVLAAGGVLSATVLLSGLGLAADDVKPKPKKPIVVEVDDQDVKKPVKVRPADDDPKPREERKPKPAREPQKAKEKVRDGDKPKPGPRDGDRPRVVTPDGRRVEVRGIDMGEIAGIKKAIMEAVQNGNEDEVRRQIERLEKALMAGPLRVIGPEGVRIPPIPPVPPLPRIDAAQMERAQREMERAQKAFADAIENLKDNPEAKEALQKAQAEYRKAMELAREKLREQFKEKGALQGFGQFDPKRFEGFKPGAFQFEGFKPGAFAFGGAGGQPRLGVAISPASEELADQLSLPKGFGVIVQNVVEGSAADKAGLRKNDVILMFAGKSVSGDNFADVVAGTKAGEKVDVVVVRKGKRETLKGVELAQPKKPEARRTEVRPRSGEFPFRFPGGEAGPGGRTQFERMSVSVNDDEFTIDATKGEIHYRLNGTVAGGKASPESITITEGRKKSQFKSFEDVPEAHRDVVKQLLGSVGGGR